MTVVQARKVTASGVRHTYRNVSKSNGRRLSSGDSVERRALKRTD